jgi:hypothetical protein
MSTALIPNRFLFDFEFPLAYRANMPRITGACEDWTPAELLPRLGEIDGQTDFADVWACWNESGLAIACRVVGKLRPLKCNPRSFWTGDNLRLCTDMRDARTNKRASRYCQQFYFLPNGGGSKGQEPVAGVNNFQRAREDAPPIPVERIQIASRLWPSQPEQYRPLHAAASTARLDLQGKSRRVKGKGAGKGNNHTTGYTLEAHIPAECLVGFDPVDHPRIGFYYILEDGDHGQQYLTVGDDLLWYVDPSTWATAVLARPADR